MAGRRCRDRRRFHDPAAPLDLGAEARLVEFLWRAAPLLSLAHDVSDGGLPVALAEAALWSGLGADVELPSGGTAVIACAPEDLDRLGGVPLLAVGVVGGDTVLGFGLDELGRPGTRCAVCSASALPTATWPA